MYNVPLLQFIKYHNCQRYQYRLLGPAEKSRINSNSEQHITVSVRQLLVFLGY